MGEMVSLARRALTHYKNSTTDLASSVMPMSVEAYIDKSRYASERERIFKHLPLALALSAELPEIGSYRAATIMEIPVLLVRGEDGEVRAFLNVCRHRGAKVCAEGTGQSRVFSCPYHAWVYDHEGYLVGQYGADTFGVVEKESLGLTQLPCAEKSGLIWVILSPGEEFDIDSWLGAFSDELDTLDLKNWYLFEQRVIPGPGWKVTMDGYLEAYHHNLVHSGTVGKHTIGNLLVLDTFGPHQRLTFGRKTLQQLDGISEDQWSSPEEHIRLIHSGFPNLSISGILGDHCLVSQIYPGVDPSSTVTHQTILVAKKPESKEEIEATQSFSAMVLQAVQEEDYGIGFSIQSALASGANKEFLFGRNEPAVQNYHKWISKFMRQEVDLI